MPDDDGLLLSRCLSLDLEVGKQDRRIQGHLLRPSDSSLVFNIVPGIGRVFPLTPFFQPSGSSSSVQLLQSLDVAVATRLEEI